MKQLNYLLFLLLFSVSFYSCSSDHDDEQSNGNGSFADGVVELPALRNGANDLLIQHTTTFNGQKITTYTAEYDKSKKHARWIAFRFDRLSAQKHVNRKPNDPDPFEADPTVDSRYQRVRADFGRKGYNRGHICASEDRVYSKDANWQTFYYTNQSPQTYDFNTGVWLELENLVRGWGRSCTASDTLYVVKGGTIDKEEHILECIDRDLSKPVPKYFYMALLFKKGDFFKAIAFWADHTKPFAKASSCVISIDELEKRTGIDFFPAVNDKLENALEASYDLSLWPGLK